MNLGLIYCGSSHQRPGSFLWQTYELDCNITNPSPPSTCGRWYSWYSPLRAARNTSQGLRCALAWRGSYFYTTTALLLVVQCSAYCWYTILKLCCSCLKMKINSSWLHWIFQSALNSHVDLTAIRRYNLESSCHRTGLLTVRVVNSTRLRVVVVLASGCGVSGVCMLP